MQYNKIHTMMNMEYLKKWDPIAQNTVNLYSKMYKKEK